VAASPSALMRKLIASSRLPATFLTICDCWAARLVLKLSRTLTPMSCASTQMVLTNNTTVKVAIVVFRSSKLREENQFFKICNPAPIQSNPGS
jgi:hypothetical protein